MPTDAPKDIFESIDQMIPLLTKQIELYRELKKALRIAEQLGVPPKELTGKVSTSVRNDMNSPFDPKPWTRCTFIIKHEATKYEFPLMMVHTDFWPPKMLEAYNRRKDAN